MKQSLLLSCSVNHQPVALNPCRRVSKILFCFLMLVIAFGVKAQTTTTFEHNQNQYGMTKTSLGTFEAQSSTQYVGNFATSNTGRGYIVFNVSSIPSNATITAATLSMLPIRSVGNTPSSTSTILFKNMTNRPTAFNWEADWTLINGTSQFASVTATVNQTLTISTAELRTKVKNNEGGFVYFGLVNSSEIAKGMEFSYDDISLTVTYTVPAPAAPTNLTASGITPNSCTLTWTKPAGTVTGYKVYQGSTFLKSVSTTTTTVQNLTPSTTYSLQVTATNGAGESPKSISAQFVTPSCASANVPGNTLANPINVTITPNVYYTDTRNNTFTNCYNNDFVSNQANGFNGQPSDDIYYKFSNPYYGKLNISTCESGLGDTYVHLLRYDGGWIASNDDNGPLCSGEKASMQRDIEPGLYYIVVEGYNSQAGSITLKFMVDNQLPPGATAANPIDAGILGNCASFYDNKCCFNASYTNSYGGSGDDIYYRFELTNTTSIHIASCSELHGFRIHLLDQNFNFIEEGTLGDCDNGERIDRSLAAGVYNLIVEGEPDSYPFQYNMPLSIWTGGCGGPPVQAERPSETEAVSIYPVPAKTHFIVESPDPDFAIFIHSIAGKKMYESTFSENVARISTADLPKGLYLVTIVSGEKKTVKRIEVIK